MDLIFSFQKENIDLANVLWVSLGSPKDLSVYKWDYLKKKYNNSTEIAMEIFNLHHYCGIFKGDTKTFLYKIIGNFENFFG